MAAPWEKVNPDNAVDRLPQPFRLVNKILEDILEAVGDDITVIVGKRKSEEYEFNLQEVTPTTCISVAGQITCTHVEPRGTTKLLVGTSLGEAILFDTRKQEILAQRHAFSENEAVSCVALCSDGSYAPRPVVPGIDNVSSAGSPPVKMFVAGVSTPRINVYNVCKENFGVVLKPACAIHLPQSEEAAEAEAAAEAAAEAGEDPKPRAPLVQQMHVKGASGGIWVLVLLAADRSLHAYFCPLGLPEQAPEEGHQLEDLTEKAIMEDEEEAEEDSKVKEEFEDTAQVKTPVYKFMLPGLALMPQMPEPDLASILLVTSAIKPKTNSVVARGTSAGQVPLLCFVSSTESNSIVAYSLRSPKPEAAPEGLDVDALITQMATPEGELKEPEQACDVAARRRWNLAAKTTTMAMSACGSLFAAGGEKGALALVDTAVGLSMRRRLPGHYSAVKSLSFHKAEVLVSIGADSWVHHYCLQKNVLLARYLISAPPSPPPAVSVVAAQSLPVALSLDTKGELRILDLKRGCKIGRALCRKPTKKAVYDDDGDLVVDEPVENSARPDEDELPRTLLNTTNTFCVVCASDMLAANSSMRRGSFEESMQMEDSGGVQGGSESQADRSWMVFFDQPAAIKGAVIAPPAAAVAPPVIEPPEKPKAEATLTPGGRTFLTRALSQAAAEATVVALTQENLKRFGQPKVQKDGAVKQPSDPVSMGGDDATKASKAEKPGALVAQNWQVSVRKHLRASLAEKDMRQHRINSRIEQLRKEIGEVS